MSTPKGSSNRSRDTCEVSRLGHGRRGGRGTLENLGVDDPQNDGSLRRGILDEGPGSGVPWNPAPPLRVGPHENGRRGLVSTTPVRGASPEDKRVRSGKTGRPVVVVEGLGSWVSVQCSVLQGCFGESTDDYVVVGSRLGTPHVLDTSQDITVVGSDKTGVGTLPTTIGVKCSLL